MPQNSGLDIRSYRVLVPVMVASPKQVRISIDDLVEAFYGADRVRPSLLSTEIGPYSLVDGDSLIIRTESGEVTVSIVEGQVSDLSNVSASEIAAVLNISQDLYIAVAEYNRRTGSEALKLVDNTKGSGAFLQVIGGTLQNVLKFPNIVDTKEETGTTWNLSKTSIYSDELKFTWDGVGINPNVYLVAKNDIVSIRGLEDGVKQFSMINGSYEVIDGGYDYFVIRNDRFDVISASLVQNSDDALVSTENKKVTLFDKDEFALTSETEGETITVTVPAVPPLARRFLKGSTHLHGNVHDVTDFTRTSIHMDISENDNKASAPNYFLLKNNYQRYEFRKQQYKVTSTDANTVGFSNYLVAADANSDYSSLPYTTPHLVGEDSLFGEVDSNLYKLTFGSYKHGLEAAWGFTLADFLPGANLTAGDINSEHFVKTVVNNQEVAFNISDGSGGITTFEGISFDPANVFRHAFSQADGSDFYIDFGTIGAAVDSGLQPGLKFKFNSTGGTNIDVYLGGLLRFRYLTVTSVVGSKVNFSAGLGVGPEGAIMGGVGGKRSGYFGGDNGTYFLDKTSTVNQERVFRDLKAIFTSYTQSANENYIGAYIFDPDGDQTNLTVSKYIVDLEQKILKGQSFTSIFTTTPDDDFPQSGDLVIDFGKVNQESPIPYRAIVVNPGSTQILIDPSYKFTKTHATGAKVQFIRANTQYVPDSSGEDLPMYITGTTSARNTMFALIRLLTASGIFVESDILLPELRYTDTAIPPFE